MATQTVCSGCNEEREYHSWDLCEPCYNLYRRRPIICAGCGKSKNRYRKNLCSSCYQHQNTVLCAICGERKPHAAKGMCKPCYDRHGRCSIICTKCGKKARHQGKNMCSSCYFREHNAKRQEKKAADNRQWKKENPDKVANHLARRRAHKNSVVDTLTLEQLEFEKKIGEAAYPGEKLVLHHIIPMSKGGGHTWGNIVFIPAPLNGYIWDRLPEEVYKQLALS